MKKVYRHFLISFSIVSILLFAAVGSMMIRQNTKSVETGLNQILNQVEEKFDEQQKDYASKLQLREEDYRNRAEAIRYVLTKDQAEHSVEGLESLRDIMGVRDIYILRANGDVLSSTQSITKGRNLAEWSGTAEILSFARGETGQDVIIHLDKKKRNGDRSDDYVAVSVENEEFTTILITYYEEVLDEIKEESGIDYVLKEFITEYQTTVAAVDWKGEVIGITKGKTQEFVPDGSNREKDPLEFAQSVKKGKRVLINGQYVYAMSREYVDFVLCAYYDLGTNLKMMMVGLAGLAIGITVAMIFVFALLQRFVNRYLIRDLSRMTEDIQGFLSGDDTREIRPCTNEELKGLNQAIANVREGYRNKSYRLDKLVGGMDSNIGMFECLEYMHSFYISENMQRLLGLGDSEFLRLKESYEQFQTFMEELEQKTDENQMVLYNAKWLRVVVYRMGKEYMGLVVDKTPEYLAHQKTMEKLEEARRDSLTGLLGRAMFEKKVRQYIEEEEHVGGIMVALDLDNFKKINDNLGHLEGDKALKIMADCLKKSFRSSDIIGRFGGDEFFVFMLYKMPRDVVVSKMDALLQSIRTEMTDYAAYQVSASIGVAFAGDELDEYTTLIEASDTALYIAKGLGKNQYYINDAGIRCMEQTCKHCRIECPRREALGLE